MINQQQPITPTPELVRNWALFQNEQDPEALWLRIGTLAARWGADMELEACCKWLPVSKFWSADDLRRHRRPKPPSLKEQALKQLVDLDRVSTGDYSAIRRALEALPND